ncbi:hypothetical protein M8J75_007382 [Diaphorina citri]|nr:hypothetical protein M8J75_007382 [Diaphorina citri]
MFVLNPYTRYYNSVQYATIPYSGYYNSVQYATIVPYSGYYNSVQYATIPYSRYYNRTKHFVQNPPYLGKVSTNPRSDTKVLFRFEGKLSFKIGEILQIPNI